MKTIGITAEFNPLHKGHEYILHAARERFGADCILVVMSGDYVQRGEPALVDKYARTEAALHAGADAVLELPLFFATSGASAFARGAVSALLHSASCDALLFGSECGDMDELKNIAAASRSNPHKAHGGHFTAMEERPSANDLLASEYLRALEYFHAPIQPLTVGRSGAAHDEIDATGESLSALRLREGLLLGEDVSPYMPERSADILKRYSHEKNLLCADSYSELLYYALLSSQSKGYTAYCDIYPDLSDKIASRLEEYQSFSQYAVLLKSKDLRLSQIRRALLHILLDIKKEQYITACEDFNYCPYLRLLGLKKDSPLLKRIRGNCDRPLISKAANAKEQLNTKALGLFEKNIEASNLYAHIAQKNGSSPSDYRREIVII